MSQQVTITGATGTGPYNIYVCDTSLSTCQLYTTVTTIPPSFTLTLSGSFETVSSVIIKIVDSIGCSTTHLLNCPPTPTPTPTQTPTPTPVVYTYCDCWDVINPTNNNLYYGYTDCSSVVFNNVLLQSGVTMFLCGSGVTGTTGIVIAYNGVCVNGSCSNNSIPTPTPTPTQSLSPTPTPTPTPSQTPCIPVNYYYSGAPDMGGGNINIYCFSDAGGTTQIPSPCDLTININYVDNSGPVSGLDVAFAIGQPQVGYNPGFAPYTFVCINSITPTGACDCVTLNNLTPCV